MQWLMFCSCVLIDCATFRISTANFTAAFLQFGYFFETLFFQSSNDKKHLNYGDNFELRLT